MGAAIVPMDRDGLDIKHNRNGMGMIGSGSHDVIFTEYFIKNGELDNIGEFWEVQFTNAFRYERR